MTAQQLKIIVAHDDHLGIGKDNQLPWDFPRDLKFFKNLTMTVSDRQKTNAVIMGRVTWESIPNEYKPLPGRYNLVLSKNSNTTLPKSVILCRSFKQAISSLSELSIETSFLIGGGAVFKEALNRGLCDVIFATEIQGNFQCDRFFPEYRQTFERIDHSEWQEENGYSLRFNLYVRKRKS